MGPKSPRSTLLTPAEEGIVVVAFWQETLLPRHCLGLPAGSHHQPQPSALASLYSAARRFWLPAQETKAQRKRFNTYEIGYVHTDSRELSPHRRQTGDAPRHRVGIEVHLHRAPRLSREDGRCDLPQDRGRGLPPDDADHADRRRHGPRRPAREPQDPAAISSARISPTASASPTSTRSSARRNHHSG